MMKSWKTPKLVILVRGKPQERILEFCKNLAGGPFGPGSNNPGCYVEEGTPCVECSGDSTT